MGQIVFLPISSAARGGSGVNTESQNGDCRFTRKRFGVFGVLRGTFWPENDEKAFK